MAKTKDGKKIVNVKSYMRGESQVKRHYRSTPNRAVQVEESEEKGSIIGIIFRLLFSRK